MKRKLSIGEMAEASGLSIVTLRLYHRKGLCVPALVDERTGRRFYDINQRARLDDIRRLQFVGYTLAEIDQLLKGDFEGLGASVEAKLKDIDREIGRLEAAKRECSILLAQSRIKQDGPPVGRVVFERIPDRMALVYAVDPIERSSFAKRGDLFGEWEAVVSLVRGDLGRRGLHGAALNRLCAMTDRQALEEGRDVITGCCLFTGGESAAETVPDASPAEVRVIRGGWYAVLYQDENVTKEGRYKTSQAIGALLEGIGAARREVEGAYIGEPLVEGAHFAYPFRDGLCRLQIPVSASKEDAPGTVEERQGQGGGSV